MIKQKLIRLINDTYDNADKLEEYADEGWKIKNISACATNHDTFCYVLLEKYVKKEKTKKNDRSTRLR